MDNFWLFPLRLVDIRFYAGPGMIHFAAFFLRNRMDHCKCTFPPETRFLLLPRFPLPVELCASLFSAGDLFLSRKSGPLS